MALKPKMAFGAVAGVVVQFGLAILGLGGLVPFFSHPALIALAIVSVGLTVAALFSDGNLSSGAREDRSNRWVLIAFTAIAFLLSYLPAYTDRNGIWTLDGDGLRWIGVVLVALGGALRLWPVFVLGNRFSGLVAIQPGHRLVTHGLYGFIRNPSYLGLLVMSLGWALAFRSGVGLVLVAFFLFPLVARINAEEKLLRLQFGSEYQAYCTRTWRLIPWLY